MIPHEPNGAVQRDLGAHDARLDTLEKTVDRIETKLDAALKALAVAEGRRTVLGAGLAALVSAVTALVVKWLSLGAGPPGSP